MRLLLDECVDRRLARELSGHEVKTVPQMGWAGIKNGRLLTLAESEFEVLITVDRSLSFQQNLIQCGIAILVRRVPSNRLANLIPLVPQIVAALTALGKGQVETIGN
ncbi:MAG: DUF5615 family PIN-like protein [Pyrinomonadaceae bacterium]